MLIKNAKIYGQELKDVLIKNGKIEKIGENLQDNEVFDAKEACLLPSFVDLCVSLKNDKFSLSNLENLEQDCLKSGVCAVLLRDCMDFDEESLALFLHDLKQRKLSIFSSVKALNKQAELRNLATLLNKGAKALELDSASNANTLRASMQYALMKEAFVFVRCFEPDFDDKGVMNDSQTSFELGLIGMSKVSELSEVAKMREVAKSYGTRVVFDLLSLKDSLNLLENELVLVSIHHLFKDDTACAGFNTAAKILPPLRSKEDQNFLKNALKEGKISFLSSLHSPKSLSLKDLAFDEAAYGIHSICEFISLCYSFLIKDKFMTWQELCKFTSLNPSEFLGLNSGKIEEGRLANLVLFDENASLKAPKNSLYANDELKGVVKAHFIKGERVF
ncbi:dihydroorotase [Campylobacter sp. MIT 99-7217]|uniref:metal-dependent hydrolase n=1 Tax=Campylobacter sp. MIT 99-7217 TaxID=535091 RepID=UPI00115A2A9A|nr:metal-dependent hydrolase [Campylobacter sp. MIT 99-7217]TQR34595.1 dihydroorotase [Campylobacter sp. MIT 99-7217]